MTTERMEVQRTIAAEPSAIFAVLADPQGHVTIDASGMLMDATGDRVTAVGDTFVVHMDREALNDYPKFGIWPSQNSCSARKYWTLQVVDGSMW
jgi:hypothetical protein